MKKASVSVIKINLIVLLFIPAVGLAGCTSKMTTMNIDGNQSSSRSITSITPAESPDQIASMLLGHPEMTNGGIYLYFAASREFMQTSGAAPILKSYLDPATEGNSKLDGGENVYFIHVTRPVNTPRSPDHQINIYEHPIVSNGQQRMMRINNYSNSQVQLNSPQTTANVDKGGHTFYFVWAEPAKLVKGSCYGARIETRMARLGDLLPAFCH